MNPHSLPPPADLRARILDEARRQPSPTSGERRRLVSVATVAGALPTIGLLVWFGSENGRRPAILAVLALGGGLAALAAMFLAAARGSSMLGRAWTTLAAVTLLAPLALFGSTLLAVDLEGAVAFAGGTLQQHVSCFTLTMLFAIAPFAAAIYVRKGTDPVHPRALGAAIGAAAGACGGVLIDLHCTLTSVEHLAAAHALPIAFVALIGALVGARVLGVRGRP